ncbi:MAG TPA: hypothetical protein VJP86_15855 [Vicinamibacterales bacterium]|jgi:hypothetical protein|nr:hypothetical protein [Vicinamibacterales bacterium]
MTGRGLQARTLLVVAWLASCFLFIYLPDVGRGFISDDFGWILRSRAGSLDDVVAWFTRPAMGFYRPLVALSFAANERLTGLWPMGYALVNVLLALATAAAIGALVRRLGLPLGSALFGAALWLFNFHSLRMALMWISGRTSLLAALFAALAGLAYARGRPLAVGALTLCALLSKEEPALLPLIFLSWAVVDRLISEPPAVQRSFSVAAGMAASSAIGLMVYLALRVPTSAMTPASAPEYYKFTISPSIVGANALSYLDRSMTLAALVLTLGWLLFSRKPIALTSDEKRVALKGLAWLILGFGVTVWVPVRSSLYVCFPAIGASLIGAAIGAAVWRTIPVSRMRVAAASLLILPLALTPVYRSRNARTRAEAELATHVINVVRDRTAQHPDVQRIVLYDNTSQPPPVSSSFNWALPEAMELTVGHAVEVDLRLGTPRATDDRALAIEIRN